MNLEQRQRAGSALRVKIAELSSSVPRIASKAGVSPATLRALEKGTRWPNQRTRELIEEAVGWRPGELMRRAVGSRVVDNLEALATHELFDLADAVWQEIRKRCGPDPV